MLKLSEISKTALRTLEIFEYLIESNKSLTLKDITQYFDYNKTSIYRSLKTLEEKNFVGQDSESKKYYPTFKLATLAGKIINKIDLRDLAIPHMKELVDEVNLTVHFSVREGNEVVFIYKVDPHNDFKLSFDLGRRSPIYCTSSGKAILAHLSEKEQSDLLEGLEIKRFTENTITDKKELLSELKLIKKRGFAIDNGEHNKGIMCLGSPILNNNGEANYAISIIGLKNEIEKKKVKYLSNLIKEKAHKISKNIF